MAININVQYKGGFLPDIILLAQGYYLRGTHFKFCGRGFVLFQAYKTAILELYASWKVVGSVVKRKCIYSLHQSHYFNVFCVLDYKTVLYKVDGNIII